MFQTAAGASGGGSCCRGDGEESCRGGRPAAGGGAFSQDRYRNAARVQRAVSHTHTHTQHMIIYTNTVQSEPHQNPVRTLSELRVLPPVCMQHLSQYMNISFHDHFRIYLVYKFKKFVPVTVCCLFPTDCPTSWRRRMRTTQSKF